MARKQRRRHGSISTAKERKGTPFWKTERGRASVAFLLLCALVSALYFYNRESAVKSNGPANLSDGGSWQTCDVFAAPSKIEGGGWGVYAARAFDAGEVVEVAPLFVPVDRDVPALVSGAIDDYYYGMGYVDYSDPNRKRRFQGIPALGTIMINNHNPKSNVQNRNLGRVPSNDQPDTAIANVYVAKRPIEAGEELFTNYEPQDGGHTWFKQRGLDLIVKDPKETQLTGEDLVGAAARYCSKIYSGLGKPNWERVQNGENWLHSSKRTRRNYFVQENKLAPMDAAVGEVFAKEGVQVGTVIETSPALAIRWTYAKQSALELLVFGWGDLSEEHREKMARLRKEGFLVMQYQGKDTKFIEGNITGSRRIERWTGLGDVALFSLGSIGMVKRVGGTSEEANCRLVIRPSQNLDSAQEDGIRGSSGILLDVVATSDIRVGDVLKLNVAPAGSFSDRPQLLNELKRMGQPSPNVMHQEHEADGGEGEL